MVEINWTREPQLWLRDIYNYIARENPEAARRTLIGIFHKAQLLRRHPRLGYLYEPEQSPEIRILLYGHYRIAYVIKADNSIDILGVFHGALSIERYLL